MSGYLDFTNLTRPASPNSYLVLPKGFACPATPDLASPVYACTPGELFDTLIGLVRENARDKDLQADLASRRISYVAVTPLLKFKDDVDIAVIESGSTTDAPQSELAIYSRSRIGYSDLGANKKRVNALLKAVAAQIGT